MKFSGIDALATGIVSLVAGIQFLRAIRDFSLVFYETIFLIASLVAAVKIFIPVHNLSGLSAPVSFLVIFVIFAILGIIIASIFNQTLEFGFGSFNYFFGLIIGIACGFVVGHTVLRTLIIAYRETKPELVESIHRSWMASQVLYFGAFRELIGMLRIARYHNI